MGNLIINETLLSNEVKTKLAIALGWTPEVEDTSQEIQGDTYPIIENPISRDDFLATAIVQEIMTTIIRRGREKMILSINEQIDKINNGDLDHLIIN